MFVFSAMVACAATGLTDLKTVALSPVKLPSSVLKVLVISLKMRASAGARSPTRKWMTSPGTRSEAGRSLIQDLSRKTRAVSGCIFFRASNESSADLLCHTPTQAFNASIITIMKGSETACRSFSKPAKIAERIATDRRTCTSLSSNCSSTSLIRDFVGG